MRTGAVWVVVLGSLAWASCKKEQRPVLEPQPVPPAKVEPTAKPLPTGSLRRAGFVSYGVYFASTPRQSPEGVFRILTTKATFKVLETPTDVEVPAVHGWALNIAKAPPPTVETLSFFGRGLTNEQRTAVAASSSMFALAFTYPAAAIPGALQAADDLVATLAAQTGGFIWDAETRELFTPEAFHALRQEAWHEVIPQVPRQVTIHAYANDDGSYRAVSLGMNKLGLPDLCVDRFPGDRMKQVDALLQSSLQAIHDTPDVVKSGVLTVGALAIPARLREPQEGDNPNQLVELLPSPAMLDQTASLDRVVGVRPDDRALLEASKKARARLPELRRTFSADLVAGRAVRLKAPFIEGAEREYMWVLVRRWDSNQLSGTLLDSPRYVHGLVAGATVTIREADVFDFTRELPDGGLEGDETTRVLSGNE